MELAPESPKEVTLESSEEISPDSKELAPEWLHFSLLAGATEIPSDFSANKKTSVPQESQT
jgi:hypothetical protein